MVGGRLGERLVDERLAQHQPAGDLRQRRADGLGDERDRSRGAWVGLEHVEAPPGHRVLNVDQADHAELERDPPGGVPDLLEHLLAEAHGRQHACRVSGVDARLLDVLHDPDDANVLPVGERVDVHLDRVLEEAVEK